jgi:hypothetical protein
MRSESLFYFQINPLMVRCQNKKKCNKACRIENPHPFSIDAVLLYILSIDIYISRRSVIHMAVAIFEIHSIKNYQKT